jgi:hypothetical protein
MARLVPPMDRDSTQPTIHVRIRKRLPADPQTCGGPDTSASVRLPGYSRIWRRGFAEGCAHTFGGSGGTGTTASKNCAAVACRSSEPRSLPVHRRGSGVCQDTPGSRQRCVTTTSTHSVSPDSMFRHRLNPIEPPWYATRMPSGVGGAAPRGAPLSRSIQFIMRAWRPITRR